jgi:hypothetical protein
MDYSKTIIYKIVSNDLNIKEVYVGSTVNFTRRKHAHKIVCNDVNSKEYNEKKYQFIREHGGFDNWSMYEVEKYPCKDKNEAHARERFWIESFNATLNTSIPTRTYKEYREDNKEIKKQYDKEYREDNRDKIIELKKQYYEDNKDKILEYHKQYNEENKKKILEYQKQYNETNKEVISERKKLTFVCECGSICRINAKSRHNKTNKHMKYIESLTK